MTQRTTSSMLVKSYNVRNCEPSDPITVVTADPWYCGYASALAQIWRLHGDGQMVRHLLVAGGITIKHLEVGGVDDLDMGAIYTALSHGLQAP